MTDNDQFLRELIQIQQKGFEERVASILQVQTKMSDDISDIKATSRETLKVIDLMAKEAERLRLDVEKEKNSTRVELESVKSLCTNCPARQRHNSWALTFKDIMVAVAFLVSAYSFWQTIK